MAVMRYSDMRRKEYRTSSGIALLVYGSPRPYWQSSFSTGISKSARRTPIANSIHIRHISVYQDVSLMPRNNHSGDTNRLVRACLESGSNDRCTSASVKECWTAFPFSNRFDSFSPQGGTYVRTSVLEM